ncbi:MAG: ribonuclease PH [Euryarchaeota archaeon]|nr:ribonuclease PH [Euryarchaeota archaeon]
MGKLKETPLDSDRDKSQMRTPEVELDFTKNALASVLYRQGNTVVLACATKASSLPRWFPRDATRGWVNAEYSLMPGSTDSRFRRERQGAKGRTMEIERLIARSLRGVVNLDELGPLSLTVDCDILNADGGTRCASITAASIALRLAIRRLIRSGDCLPLESRLNELDDVQLTAEQMKTHEQNVMPHDVAAISVGLIGNDVYLDLDYVLDSNADVDMNVIMTSNGEFVEIQGTGEESTFSSEQLTRLIEMSKSGISKLHTFQSDLFKEI